MKIRRGWDEARWGPKPYSKEWWLRLDVRTALKKVVERSKTPRREVEG